MVVVRTMRLQSKSRRASGRTAVQSVKLDTLPNTFHHKRFECNHVFSELTALCPVTRLPDFYTVSLSYEPDRKLVELKSLKLYLVGFRNLEVLHEEVANMIVDDFVRAVSPRRVNIELEVNNRGGIHTIIRRSWRGGRGDQRFAKRRLQSVVKQ